MQRAEKVQPRSGPAQRVQTLFIIKLEGLVPGHGNHGAVFARLLRNCGLRLPPGLVDCQKAGPVHCGFQAGCNGPHPLGQILHLAGGDQTQMPAGERRLLQLGQIAQHRYTGLLFQHGLECSIQTGTAPVQKQSLDPAVLPEGEHPLHLSRQCQTGAVGVQHQQHRELQQAGHIPGTGLIAAEGHTVVKAHHALAHRGIAARCVAAVKPAHPLFSGEKYIQVTAGHLQHRAVEHRVDIIRPALEGRRGQAPVFQRLQQAAGDRSFAAAGSRGGDHHFEHWSSSTKRRSFAASQRKRPLPPCRTAKQRKARKRTTHTGPAAGALPCARLVRPARGFLPLAVIHPSGRSSGSGLARTGSAFPGNNLPSGFVCRNSAFTAAVPHGHCTHFPILPASLLRLRAPGGDLTYILYHKTGCLYRQSGHKFRRRCLRAFAWSEWPALRPTGRSGASEGNRVPR